MHDVPWATIILLLIFISAEVICFLVKGELLSAALIDHVIKAVIAVGRELSSTRSAATRGKKVCGFILSIWGLVALGTVLFSCIKFIHGAFSDANIIEVVPAVLFTLFALSIFLALHWANEHYVAFLGTSRRESSPFSILSDEKAQQSLSPEPTQPGQLAAGSPDLEAMPINSEQSDEKENSG